MLLCIRVGVCLLRVYTWYTGKREVTHPYCVYIIIILISVSLLVIICVSVFSRHRSWHQEDRESNNNSAKRTGPKTGPAHDTSTQGRGGGAGGGWEGQLNEYCYQCAPVLQHPSSALVLAGYHAFRAMWYPVRGCSPSDRSRGLVTQARRWGRTRQTAIPVD